MQADNMLHLISTLGYVPNFNLYDSLDRSQPPVASVLVRAVYEQTRDKEWLAKAQPILAKEYAFWMTMRRSQNMLNHHGQHAAPDRIDNFYWAIHERLFTIPKDPTERMTYIAHAMAEAETGWDFNPRFERRCADFNGVDLNCLLYMHEQNHVFFCEELGSDEANLWRERANKRRERMNAYCWNDDKGFFYDYDTLNERQGSMATCAAYFALWSGLATEDQAARLVENLPLVEFEYGMVACEKGPRDDGQLYQWDYPNAWPPSQFAAIVGLQRYGYTAEAKRLSEKYIASVINGFEQTGNLWEKYNGVTGGVDVADEYAMPAMLGWTAGTFLLACEVVGV
jgi:alpha,alpha-trehalase